MRISWFGVFLLGGSFGLRAAPVDLLPDLTIWTNAARGFLYGWVLDTGWIQGHTLLRLTTATPNIGTGPLELRSTGANSNVNQRIYRSDGTFYDRLAGQFTYHPSHGHLHFDDFMQFRLRRVTAGQGVGDIVVAGEKMSFAIEDLEPYDLNLPGVPREGFYYSDLTQGISVGWADFYSFHLPDQWIDITDIADGIYWLEAAVDPDNHIVESNESNNVQRILIDLATPPPPLNDPFDNGLLITNRVLNLHLNNRSATREPGEPKHEIGRASCRERV